MKGFLLFLVLLLLACGSTAENIEDSDAVLIIRIDPRYPPPLVENKIEGWVQLTFDINEVGATANIKVSASNPKRIFDRAARRAISKWKYKPKIKNGKSVFHHNMKVQLDFKLNE